MNLRLALVLVLGLATVVALGACGSSKKATRDDKEAAKDKEKDADPEAEAEKRAKLQASPSNPVDQALAREGERWMVEQARRRAASAPAPATPVPAPAVPASQGR